MYDAYRNRVIFPIIGTGGRVLGFGARVLGDEKPKYINTGDTPIYNKRNNLYGLYLQKGRGSGELVMVEGYMDVIGLFEAGVTNAVASLGTALTVQQARLLKRFVPLVYIAYDGDAAGQQATLRGLDILSREGLDVRVIVFPDGLDPDEFVRARGREAFEALKDQALSLNAFKLESMAQGYRLTDENDRERYAKEACRFIASLEPVEQGRYYAQLAKKTGYPVEALKAQGASAGPLEAAPPRRAGAGRRASAAAEEDARTRAENALLQAMAQSREATARRRGGRGRGAAPGRGAQPHGRGDHRRLRGGRRAQLRAHHCRHAGGRGRAARRRVPRGRRRRRPGARGARLRKAHPPLRVQTADRRAHAAALRRHAARRRTGSADAANTTAHAPASRLSGASDITPFRAPAAAGREGVSGIWKSRIPVCRRSGSCSTRASQKAS